MTVGTLALLDAPGTWLRRGFGILGIGILALLSACEAAPPPPPTIVNLSFTAAPDLNPASDGEPAPARVRVYQLATPSGFDEADFFQLLEADAATLGADLISAEEFTIPPGGQRSMTREFRPDARFVGVLVAYRDIDNAQWRASTAVPPNQTSTLGVMLGRLAVSFGAPAEAGS